MAKAKTNAARQIANVPFLQLDSVFDRLEAVRQQGKTPMASSVYLALPREDRLELYLTVAFWFIKSAIVDAKAKPQPKGSDLAKLALFARQFGQLLGSDTDGTIKRLWESEDLEHIENFAGLFYGLLLHEYQRIGEALLEQAYDWCCYEYADAAGASSGH